MKLCIHLNHIRRSVANKKRGVKKQKRAKAARAKVAQFRKDQLVQKLAELNAMRGGANA